MSSIADQLKAMQEQMASLQARLVAEEAAKDAQGKIATLEEKIAQACVAKATGGGRWAKHGGGVSGSESSSAQDSDKPRLRAPGAPPRDPPLSECFKVARDVLEAEQRMEMDTEVPEAANRLDTADGTSLDGMEMNDEEMTDWGGDSAMDSTSAGPSCGASSSATSSTIIEKRRRHKAKKAAERKAAAAAVKAQAPSPHVSELRMVTYEGVLGAKAKAKATPRIFASGVAWPQVVCDQCKQVTDIWKNMSATAIEDADSDDWYWEYICKLCMMASGMTLAEAEAKILGQRSTPNWARKSRATFKEAQSNINQMHLALSKKGKRELCKSWILEAFAPYAGFIARKLLAKQLRAQNSLEYDALLESLPKETDPAKVTSIIQQMAVIEEALENERMIAVESHAPEIQTRFIAAADYCDEFINLGAGFVLRAWYICGACHATSDGSPCLHFAMAKAWPRKLEDPLAAKQAWTCALYSCWKKYSTNYGMIAELTVGNDTFWYRVPCKDWDTLDLQACMIEQELKPMSPEELYASLPSIKPSRFEDLFSVTKKPLRDGVDGSMVFEITDKKTWLAMPALPWQTIFAKFHVDRYHGNKKMA